MSTPPPNAPYQPASPMSPSDERLWATLVHVGGIFFWFIPSLIGYIVARDRSAFLREHSRSALNFQLTMLIASVISSILVIILVGFLMLAAIGIIILVFSIIAAVEANAGRYYRYPLAIQFIHA
jgi:uncharacterized protein